MKFRFSTELKLFRLIFLAAFVMAVLGCGNGEENQDNEQAVAEPEVAIEFVETEEEGVVQKWPDSELKDRMARYWLTRFSGDSDGSWEMEAPHFQFIASKKKYENYLATSRADLQRIDVKEIKQGSEYFYQVDSILIFKRSGKAQELEVSDRWVYVDDQWYHVIWDPLIFPFTSA